MLGKWGGGWGVVARKRPPEWVRPSSCSNGIQNAAFLKRLYQIRFGKGQSKVKKYKEDDVVIQGYCVCLETTERVVDGDMGKNKASCCIMSLSVKFQN